MAMSAVPAPPVAATCPEGMTKINGGATTGSDEPNADANQKPPHQVKIAAYRLDLTEVTVAAYKSCSDQGECLRAGKQNFWKDITKTQQELYDPLCKPERSGQTRRSPRQLRRSRAGGEVLRAPRATTADGGGVGARGARLRRTHLSLG